MTKPQPDPERGLPTNTDAEAAILGAILLTPSMFVQAAGSVDADCFALAKHRTIWKHMGWLQDRGEEINRITLANSLMATNELAGVDGLTYLVSLDDGVPVTGNIDSYVNVVREKAALRKIIFSSQQAINRALLNDPSQAIISDAGESLLRMGSSQVRGDGVLSAGQILERCEGGISQFLDPSKRKKGITTGFTKFDEMTCGLHGGELVVIAARPSMGKTALLLNIAQHVAIGLKKAVVIFSLEMSKESLLQRMMCSLARVDSWRFKMGYCNAEERRRLNEAMNAIASAPLYIDDQSNVDLMDMHAKLRRLQSEMEIGLVGVDYLQLMAGEGENRTQEVTRITRGMKLLAKDLNVPLALLSQLSRDVEKRPGDHRPQPSDLRESGSIEQDADLVGFIFRQEVYLKDREDLRGLAELIVAKQRNGPTGTVNLVWLGGLTRFENRAEDYGPESSQDSES